MMALARTLGAAPTGRGWTGRQGARAHSPSHLPVIRGLVPKMRYNPRLRVRGRLAPRQRAADRPDRMEPEQALAPSCRSFAGRLARAIEEP